jgi:hypothetical protein
MGSLSLSSSMVKSRPRSSLKSLRFTSITGTLHHSIQSLALLSIPRSFP